MLAVCTYARRKEEDRQEQCESAGVENSSDEVVESSEEEERLRGTSTQEERLREELEGEQEEVNVVPSKASVLRKRRRGLRSSPQVSIICICQLLPNHVTVQNTE